MKLFNKKQTQHQSGFTLIEVLITLVVFAVGLLGLAALQIRAMQFVHDAYIHSQAQVLAYDALDRIRANRIEAMTTTSYELALDDDPAAPGTNCATTNCTATEMAQFDVYEWREILKEHMPQGKGSIDMTSLNLTDTRRQYTIEIQWLDDRTTTVTDDRFQTFSFEAEL